MALPDGHGAQRWHQWAEWDHMYGIDGQTENTGMAVMDRLGAWRSLMDREHSYGTDGQMEHTCGTKGQAWDHMCGSDGQTRNWCGGTNRHTRSRNVALLGEHGARMWH